MSVSPNPPKEIDRADVLGEVQHRWEQTAGHSAGEEAGVAWVLDELAELDILRFKAPADDPRKSLRGEVRKGPEMGFIMVATDRTGFRWANLHAPAGDDHYSDSHVVGREMLNNGQKIRAIKAAREACVGLGLKEAKAFVELMPEHATCVAVLDGQLRDGVVAASREPRVFQSDGPEPPADVNAVEWLSIDHPAKLQYVRRVGSGWLWSRTPERPAPDYPATPNHWAAAVRSTPGEFREVLS